MSGGCSGFWRVVGSIQRLFFVIPGLIALIVGVCLFTCFPMAAVTGLSMCGQKIPRGEGNVPS